jgi:hypothetical protein
MASGARGPTIAARAAAPSVLPLSTSQALGRGRAANEVRLRLPPMGPMMIERLVYDRTGRWPGPLLRRILGLAAGNPLFAAELLRASTSSGALAAADPDLIEARFELNLRGTGVEAVIGAHLGQLGTPAREVMAAMAVWGTDICAGDLAAMMPGPDGPRDAALDLVLAAGLIRRDPAGTVTFPTTCSVR